jgi:hypothetical protein
MSSYYSGYWISYSDVNGYGYGENFDLLPGRGYIIKVETPTTLTFDGNKFSDPVPFDLMEGWNLIAVHGTDEVFSSRDLLSHIYDSTDIKSDNITSWLTEGQTYKGFHYDPDAKKYYGDDFELKDDKAYFVRVRDGEGLVEF